MKTNAISEVRAALLANTALVALLGGQRIYPIAAPNAEEFPRISLFEIDNRDIAFADDVAYASEVPIQIDVWSKGSTSAISGEVDKTMKEQGWARTSAPDFYEPDTKVYHKAMRYRNQFLET